MALRSIFVVVAATFALAGTSLGDHFVYTLGDHFVYTNDQQSANTVTTFRVGANGNLTNLGQTPTGGKGCLGELYASRRTKTSILLLATNDCSSNVTVFSGASTGRLVSVALIPFPTNGSGASIASDGKCFVFGSGFSVSSYLFPKLTPVSTVSVGVGGGQIVDDMKTGKPGLRRYVAAALLTANQIAVIPLSPSTCALGTVTTFNTSGTPGGPLSPAGVDIVCWRRLLYQHYSRGPYFSRRHAASGIALRVLLTPGRRKFEHGVGEQGWTVPLRGQPELV